MQYRLCGLVAFRDVCPLRYKFVVVEDNWIVDPREMDYRHNIHQMMMDFVKRVLSDSRYQTTTTQPTVNGGFVPSRLLCCFLFMKYKTKTA